MALFPISRYIGENDGEIKTIMSLKELHSIAERRSKGKDIFHTKEREGENEKEDGNEKDMTEEIKRKKMYKEKLNELSNVHKSNNNMRKRKHEYKNKEDTNNCTKRQKNNLSLEKEVEKELAQEVEEKEKEKEEKERKEEKKEEEKEEGKDEDMDDNPLPLVTRTDTHKSISSHKYQLPSWATDHYTRIENDISEYSQPLYIFGLNGEITNNLKEMGVTNLFPVQCEVIPELLSSSKGPLLSTVSGMVPSDICVCAPTGCGKTLSYVIPVISALSSTHKQYLRALVVVPSKDLALQVYKVFLAVSKGTGVRIGVICGQNNLQVEQNRLVSILGSEVDVLVATPGRLVTHLQETCFFSLSHLRYLIIDEADRIFDQSYHNWLSHVIQATSCKDNKSHSLLTSCIPRLLPSIWKPSLLENRTQTEPSSLSFNNPTVCTKDIFQPVVPLQKLLFSATLSLNPEHLSLLNLHRPKLFTVSPAIHEQLGETVLPTTLKEYFVQCTLEHKPLALLHLVLTYGHQRMLCFTHSRESTHRLTLLLQQYNAPVTEISTSLSQQAKKEILKKFKNGQVKVLVCSDGMARGMDIPDVDCVLNYDMPSHFRSYLHRVGRTARAGNKGIAYTLITHEEVRKCERLMKEVGRKHVIEKIFITQDDLKSYIDKYSTALQTISDLVLK